MEFPEISFDLNGNPNPIRELAGGWYSLTEGVSVLISDGFPVRVCSADGEEPSCDLPGLVAEATGFWTRVLPWDAAENGSAVAELRLLREQPTHRIVTRGEGECARQEFVRLHDGSAYSVSEWTRQTDPSWEVSEEGEWTCAGNPFPGGGNGEVFVKRLIRLGFWPVTRALALVADKGDFEAQLRVAQNVREALRLAGGNRRIAREILGAPKTSFEALLRRPWLRDVVSEFPATTGSPVHKNRTQ